MATLKDSKEKEDFCSKCGTKFGWFYDRRWSCGECKGVYCKKCSSKSASRALCDLCNERPEKNSSSNNDQLIAVEGKDEVCNFTEVSIKEIYETLVQSFRDKNENMNKVTKGSMKDDISDKVNMDVIRSEAGCLKENLHQLIDEKQKVIKDLNELATNLDDHYKKVCKAKITGSAVSIGGAVLGVIGFGLSFVTFGASLGLTIAGGIIAGGGGITVGGSFVSETLNARDKRKKSEQLLKDYDDRTKKVVEKWQSIDSFLCKYGNITEVFPHWAGFWIQVTYGSAKSLKHVGLDIVATSVMSGLRIANVIDDVASTGAKTTTAVIKTMSSAGRGIHIAGGVIGMIAMPLDIFTIVDSAYDLQKNNPHEMSVKIRIIAQGMDKSCITKENVAMMIDKTLETLTISSRG